MEFYFDQSLALGYKSNSQKIRVMSEQWVENNIYCPRCGNLHIDRLENNAPVADFRCGHCGEIFELKSKQGPIQKKIPDGAYETMVRRISSTTNPDLFVLQYSQIWEVTNLILIPKFFFVPSIIEKRKPLAQTARRAGWVGCNILMSDIPIQGKIQIIKNGKLAQVSDVVKQYEYVSGLNTENMQRRKWIIDVLNCVNAIDGKDFVLNDIYNFMEILQENHPDNHNVEAKIRQQLQILRDKGFIEFLGNGKYRKIIS